MRLLPLLLALALAGCTMQRAGREVASAVTGMGGAQATGAGGSTMTAPPAAAEPSEQHATEETYYAQPAPAVQPSPSESDPLPVVEFRGVYDVPAQPAAVAAPAPTPQAQPLYRRVETHTKLGAQQDVAPMLKQAGEFFGRLNRAHWLGIVAMIVGLGGILHSAGNKESGYPAVWIKVFLAGLVAVVMGGALWFWILIGLAGLLYLGQKFGILRVPLP